MAENEEKIKEATPKKMENVENGPDGAVTAVVESSTESTAAVPKQEAEVAPLVIKTPGMEGVDKIVIKRANSAPLTIEESAVHPLSPRAEAERKKKSPDRTSTSMSDASHSQLSAQTTPAPNQEAFDEFINSPQGQNVIVERSPGGRYVRFMEKLGSGATKDVYRAYDTTEGIEVAWNVVNLAGVPKPERNRIVNEVRLLERLHHPNIISFHGSWVNREKQEVNFVTEILSSGTLKNFIDKVQVIRWKIAKRWAFQILNGLDYLHSQDPPVIHRDLKCDNIFINGTSGDLRIGDLGLSTVHRHGKVLSVLGTPEFMAPDLYEEAAYDEKVDVYAFGMVLLEILTKEIPYKECTNPAQIYKKVMSGIPPESLGRLRSKKARDYVLLCLGQKDEATGKYVRPSTSELLQHPFLGPGPDDEAEVEVDPPLQHRTIAEEGEARSGGEDQASDDLGSTGSIDAVAEATTSPDAAAVARRQSRYSDGSSLSQDDSDHFEEMPDSEVNIRRVKVMMGRGQELAEEESQAPQLHESVRSVESLTDAQESLRSIDPKASLQESNRSVDSLKSSGQGATTTKPPADGQGDSVEGGNKTGEDGRANLCVAAAVVHDESPLVRPYDDDILKLIIRLPVDGQTQNVQFDFHLVNDDAIQVAREMVAELDIPETAVLEISETISGLAKNARMKQAKYVQRQQQWQKEQMQPQHQQQSGSVANQQQQPPQSSQQQYNQPVNHGMQQSMPTEGLAQQQMPQQQQAPMSQTVGQGMHLSEGFQQQQQPGMVQQLPQHQPPQHQGELYQPQHQPGVPMQQHLPGSQPLNGGAHQAGYVQGQAPSQPPGMMNQQQIAQAAQGQGGGGMQQGPGTALPQSHQMSQQHPPPSQNQFHLQNQGQAMQTIPPGQSQVPPQRPTADPHATMQYSAPAQGQMEYQNASQQQFQQSAAPLQGQTDYPSPLTPALAPPQGEYQQVAQQQFQAVQHGQAADYQGAPAPPPPPPPPPQPPVALEYPSLGQNGHHGYPLDAPDYQQKQPPLHPGTAASEGMYTASPPPPRLYQAAAVANSSAASLGTSLSSFGDSRPNSRSASVSSVSLRDELEETEGETDEVSEDDEVVDSNVSEEGSEVEEELRRLEEDFQKNLLRAQKVFDSRMDNLQRSKEEKEAQHLKTLEKHEKEKAEFEKRVRQAEKEQSRRIEQLQREWDRKREKLAMHKKKHGESISAPNSPAHEQRHDSSRSPPPVPSSKAEQAVENDVLP